MSAVRVARAFTGRDRIVKFEGCYHGHGDAFLVKAGSGATTLGIPTSPGVPAAVAADTLLARYNDLASVAALCDDTCREDRGPHRRADRRQHGTGAARRRISDRAARPLHAPRHPADLRRGDLRLPRVGRRCAGNSSASGRISRASARSSAAAFQSARTAAARTSWSWWPRRAPSTRRARSPAIRSP